LSQEDFGHVLGVGQAAVSKFEKGLSFPSVEILIKLKEFSGRSLDWIITGEDPQKQK
jgi:transcriptional regulator with XRE-family HTH domain